ncbi:2-hydroxychromene-2-carboxylate isomerase [Pararhodospirillum oryzae]|uniref:2-hydroxychromene-2-carboxylate isomerase n=1 Tax=Pararhodospirillum oryzae TaxID=478448 RepID=A0A512H819_9PROT|nr:2-hydroxychromene-2-carboxylate isomerase [Pararhodospirillum oryzae]GEO81584.1 2-hydroxychromene-2-carboxylate isomerase [Pararhodospirillum oryzae]
MPEPLTFYFDFTSPYSWIAAERITMIAARHAREVRWRAILVGPLMRESGNEPLLHQPLKGAYFRRDIARCFRLHGLEGRLPAVFPVLTTAAARTFHWVRAQGREPAQAFALAVFRAYFREGRDIADPAEIAALAATLGHDPDEVLAVTRDPTWKSRLIDEVERARKDGVCGVPYVLVDGEPFWGADRLDMLEAWLSRGGW